MQKDDDRCLLLRIEIIYRRINPEVVTSRNLIFHSSQKVVSRHAAYGKTE
ncbi:Uncharacterised protein [Segatella copri]|nr:Uncharacterised protein [Segatella copri]